MVGALAKHADGERPTILDPLPDMLAALRRVSRPGSLICLVGDLQGLVSAERRQLSQLARHNDVVIVGIHDPIEAELPPPGLYTVTDGHSEWAIDTVSEGSRRAHKERHLRRVEYLEDLCRRNRMRWIPCATDDDPAVILSEHLSRPANG